MDIETKLASLVIYERPIDDGEIQILSSKPVQVPFRIMPLDGRTDLGRIPAITHVFNDMELSLWPIHDGYNVHAVLGLIDRDEDPVNSDRQFGTNHEEISLKGYDRALHAVIPVDSGGGFSDALLTYGLMIGLTSDENGQVIRPMVGTFA